MSKNPKTGLEGLLRPEDSILVLIDHQPYQFTNLNSHEPTMIIHNVIGLAKSEILLEHGGASAVTLAWELQLLATTPSATSGGH